MFGNLLPLIFAVSILGCVVYGVVRAVKPHFGVWGGTPKGKLFLTLLPLLLGLLGSGALDGLQGYAAELFGSEEGPHMGWGSRLMLGLFAGTFSTFIHNLVRNFVGKKVKSEGIAPSS